MRVYLSFLRIFTIACVLSTAALGSTWAAGSEADRIAELERQLARMYERLQVLETQVGRTAAVSVEPAPAPPAAGGWGGVTPLKDPQVAAGLPIRAFVDAGYARDSRDPTGRKGGFAIGNVDLYFTPSWGDRVKSIVELVFEPNARGEMLVDIERVQLGYTFDDRLTGWIGRYHTPFGYWNAEFHHGAQIQTSILRPRFLAFEDQGGILPVHGVGLLGSGTFSLGGGRTKYDAYVANGSAIEDGELVTRGAKDDDGKKMFGLNLRHEFGGGLEGLTVGAHALTARVGSYDGAGTLLGATRLRVSGAYIAFERDRWELLGEYYAFRNRDLSGGTGSHSSWAGYSQVGYTIGDHLTPYIRLERASLNQSDGYFSTMHAGRSYRRQSIGLKYELNPVTALKLELGRTTEDVSGLRSNGFRTQIAVRF